VVENGLCNRVRNGRPYNRADGWDRPRYLRENIAAVVEAIDDGVPVTGYWHWSLVDNYEWGSYEPRFGLYGVDRHRGDHGMRWLGTDSMGGDAAGTYRRIISGLRDGDRSVLRES
jgi:beta-glucosidase